MIIIKETANLLNLEQTQMNMELINIFHFLVDFIMKCSLIIHGELINGSGLQEVLEKNNFSIIGTGSVVNANHIKQARYFIQVIICGLYSKLTEARNAANSALSPFEWLYISLSYNFEIHGNKLIGR